MCRDLTEVLMHLYNSTKFQDLSMSLVSTYKAAQLAKTPQVLEMMTLFQYLLRIPFCFC